jgi:hypothetical protein
VRFVKDALLFGACPSMYVDYITFIHTSLHLQNYQLAEDALSDMQWLTFKLPGLNAIATTLLRQT